MKAFLVLEDGSVYEGVHIGVNKEIIGEVVFNTSMVGYLEEWTDPAYSGQILCMTWPLTGNYGVCWEDGESERAWPAGIIVKELSRSASNFRKDTTIQSYLETQGLSGIAGIDTRALTKHLRIHGTMTGCVIPGHSLSSANMDSPALEAVLSKIKTWRAHNIVKHVTCKKSYEVSGVRDLSENGVPAGQARFDEVAYRSGIREIRPAYIHTLNGKGLRIAILDMGLKSSLIRSLTGRGCDVKVYPAVASAEELMEDMPDGIVISGGPGAPGDCPDTLAQIRILFQEDIPIFAIGLGHQLLALAAGGETFKMKHGHRGSNHPVREQKNGNVLITSQNHGYAVDMKSMDSQIAVPAYIHINDDTCEGFVYCRKPFFSVQFDPEPFQDTVACQNPYDRFLSLLNDNKLKKPPLNSIQLNHTGNVDSKLEKNLPYTGAESIRPDRMEDDKNA